MRVQVNLTLCGTKKREKTFISPLSVKRKLLYERDKILKEQNKKHQEQTREHIRPCLGEGYDDDDHNKYPGLTQEELEKFLKCYW